MRISHMAVLTMAAAVQTASDQGYGGAGNGSTNFGHDHATGNAGIDHRQPHTAAFSIN